MKRKTLSEDEYLKAYALFTMARSKQLECEQFVGALRKLLFGSEETYAEHVEDEVYGQDRGFDIALRLAGFRRETPGDNPTHDHAVGE